MSTSAIRTPVLILTGVAGAGKTTAAEGLSARFAVAGIHHAMIDLDFLCQVHPMNGVDNDALLFDNIASIWPNYARRGMRALVAARIIERPEQLDRYKAAIPGCDLIVVRIEAPPLVVDARLDSREHGEWVDIMKRLTRRHRATLQEHAFERFTVHNVDKTPNELGSEIFDLLVERGDIDVVDLTTP